MGLKRGTQDPQAGALSQPLRRWAAAANIFPAIEEHAADKIYRHGVSMSINTDARTVTPVTLSGEYNKLQDTFHWTNEHFLRCNLEGIRHSFTTEAVKQKIAAQIQEGYNKR